MTPLVSCIMPTYNRREFIPHAIQYFLRQDYINKELVIVDDGSDSVEDLVPDNKFIRYIKLSYRTTLGYKRNFCVKESRGNLIMHWDDDDWMAPYRISYQVKELLAHEAEVCGLSQMLFCEIRTGNCWQYKYPPHAQAWLAGGSLLYTREFWKKKPFPNIQIASDTKFIFSRKLEKYVALEDYKFYVATIHGNNTSPKVTSNNLWLSVDSSVVKNIIGVDKFHFYKFPDYKFPAMVPMPIKKEVSSRKKIAILISTCNRPEFLKQIINDLQQEEVSFDLKFFIVDDGILLNGKKYYWKTINTLWKQARGQHFDYYIQLPDDVLLEGNFIKRAVQAWENIIDSRKICLNLFLDGHRIGKTCWTNFRPEIKEFNGYRYINTQWVDMAFISCKMFFEELQWSISPIPLHRWTNNPELSSGVGQQISIRLHQKGWNLYQTTEKLIEHIGDDSFMNSEIRKKEPLKFTMLPRIFAGIASIPEREGQLKNAVSSVVPYVDQLFLYLNDYCKVPDWLANYKKVTPFLSSELNSNMGDSGKFFGLNKITDDDYYYFTLDDDMVYPSEYVWKMIEKIEKYNRKCIVGCGGYIMKPLVNHFYADRGANWHITMPNTEDRPAHILHTCLTAWHSSALKFRYEDCKKPNMGDLWLAINAQQQQVPMILIERPANWIVIQPNPLQKTIYGRYHNNCHDQTSIYNSWREWKLFPIKE